MHAHFTKLAYASNFAILYLGRECGYGDYNLITNQDMVILHLKAGGLSDQAVADYLSTKAKPFPKATVKKRLVRLYKEWGVKNAAQLIDKLREKNILKVPTLKFKPGQELKEREELIAPHLVKGKTNAQISAATGIPESSVERLIARMRRRYDRKNRVHLALYLAQRGY